uniref:ATP synthase complex subunit 8 n=1 Tax=Simulium jisigouense TaxID=2893561 RepID=A0A9Y2TCG7_9DIPT|nr:ATP synthase F0 subunit 8 [Simulium jisigouense]WIV81712.1 ATP synthase F0 subunit 8 [Simulium jisigouense]
MAPISWLSLFILFTIIFFLFNIMNYFCVVFTPSLDKSEDKTTQLTPPSLNWKW